MNIKKQGLISRNRTVLDCCIDFIFLLLVLVLKKV